MITKKRTNAELQKTIDRLHEEMIGEEGCSERYAAMVDQLGKLYKLRDEVNSSRSVTPDTLAIVIGNLAGIILIVGHEHAHVISSKALGFILRAR